jgi:hypothetical protein
LGFATKHVAVFSTLVYKLIHSYGEKIKEHDFRYRPHTAKGCSDGSTGYGSFRNRGVNYSIFTEFFK